MAEAKQGDTVRVHYTGKLDDDSVFDSSYERDEPLEFTVGSQQVIPGFDEAVVGMEPGDTKQVRLEPDEAYGEHQDDHVVEVEKERLPDDVDAEVGLRLQLQHEDGETIPVTLTEVSGETVTLDANHPLAGEALTFEIELVEIED